MTWYHHLRPSFRRPTWWDVLHYGTRAVQGIGIVWVIQNYVVDMRSCIGASMLPTLRAEGTWVLISRYPPALRPPSLKIGDLVSAQSPVRPDREVCKRVIGLPGDTVCVDPVGAARGHGGWEDGAGGREHVVVPKGHVWVAGDNMSGSIDSRMFGPISLALIRGKVFYRLLPNPGPLENALHELDIDDDD
ncbi:LexA/Signal peptidase [Calocera cornea HHB12733]|uniref:Mitochondrial inner membrane protease subunit n=1 Tax=Calocera cornea HHB12733 TaxID=1353952 RepID=A0A165FGY6_9BASI|nr:LexA/Signal peptidase [Calocera cornea HHB12733]